MLRVVRNIFFALCTFYSCSSHAEKYDIYNYAYDLNDWYIQYIADNILAEAKERNLSVNVLDAQNNVSNQSHQFIENFDSSAPLAMNMVYIPDAQRIVDYVKAHNVNLIFYNRKPLFPTLASYDKAWYVGVQPNKSGYAQGQMIADYLQEHEEVDKNNDGIINIIMLKGQAIHYATDLRCRAILKALRENDIEFRIIDEYNADFSFELAKRHMNNVLKIRGTGPIELIVANCDAMALGAVKALNDFGFNLGYSKNKKIPVFGWSGLPESLQAIKKNKMQGTIAIDVKTMAELIIELAMSTTPNFNQLQERYKFNFYKEKKEIDVRYRIIRQKDLKDLNQPLFD